MTDDGMGEDEYETVYQVYAADKYAFGGDGTKWVAVTEETEDQIIGIEYPPTYPEPMGRVVFNKEHVAGWKEDTARIKKLNTTDEELKQELEMLKSDDSVPFSDEDLEKTWEAMTGEDYED